MIQTFTLQEIQKHGGVEVLVFTGTGIAVDKDTKTSPIPVMGFKEADFFVYLSALTSDKTVDITVLSRVPGADNQWASLGTFVQITAPAGVLTNNVQKKAFPANLGSQLAVNVDLSAATTATLKIWAVLKAR